MFRCLLCDLLVYLFFYAIKARHPWEYWRTKITTLASSLRNRRSTDDMRAQSSASLNLLGGNAFMIRTDKRFMIGNTVISVGDTGISVGGYSN